MKPIPKILPINMILLYTSDGNKFVISKPSKYSNLNMGRLFGLNCCNADKNNTILSTNTPKIMIDFFINFLVNG